MQMIINSQNSQHLKIKVQIQMFVFDLVNLDFPLKFPLNVLHIAAFPVYMLFSIETQTTQQHKEQLQTTDGLQILIQVENRSNFSESLSLKRRIVGWGVGGGWVTLHHSLSTQLSTHDT